MACNLSSAEPSVRAAVGEYATTAFTRAAQAVVDRFANEAARARGDGGARLLLQLAYNAIHPVVSVPAWLDGDAEFAALNASLAASGASRARRELAGALLLVDRGVGDVKGSLEAHGMWNDTLLVVISDNGAEVKSGGSNWPLRGEKATLWEGGHRVPAFVYSPSLPARARGATYAGLFYVTDWAPTILGGVCLLYTSPSPRD